MKYTLLYTYYLVKTNLRCESCKKKTSSSPFSNLFFLDEIQFFVVLLDILIFVINEKVENGDVECDSFEICPTNQNDDNSTQLSADSRQYVDEQRRYIAEVSSSPRKSTAAVAIIATAASVADKARKCLQTMRS